LHLGCTYLLHQHLLLHQELVVAIEAGVRNIGTKEVVVLEQVLVVARYLGLVCQAHSTFRAALMTQRLVRLLALVVI